MSDEQIANSEEKTDIKLIWKIIFFANTNRHFLVSWRNISAKTLKSFKMLKIKRK